MLAAAGLERVHVLVAAEPVVAAPPDTRTTSTEQPSSNAHHSDECHSLAASTGPRGISARMSSRAIATVSGPMPHIAQRSRSRVSTAWRADAQSWLLR